MRNKVVYIFCLLNIILLHCFCHKKDDIKTAEDRIVTSSIDKIIVEDTTLSVSKQIELDLNKDSSIDFIFYYAINYYHGNTYYSPFYMYVEPLGENELLISSDLENPHVLAMKAGNNFTGRWSTSYGTLVNPPIDLPWEGLGPRYMGFRIKKNDKFYIGWLKMEVGTKGSQIVFYEYGLRLDGANQMKAGQR